MKIGIIIETNDHEKSWNGVRFGNAEIKKGHEVKIFLMSAGVEIENIKNEKNNVPLQLQEFSKSGGVLLACGTCIKSRNQKETDVCPISTMNDCVELVEWEDKMVTF
jgi:uncharacterized protein involved in oxidation of intracellular sulfur